MTVTPYPFPYYAGFTAFTPNIPQFNWNIRSQEQCILEIMAQQNKTAAYLDTIADTINSQYEAFDTVEEAATDAQEAAESAAPPNSNIVILLPS